MVRGFRGLRYERVAAMSPPYPVSGVLKRAALWLYRRRRQAPPGRITGNNLFLWRNSGVSTPPPCCSLRRLFPFSRILSSSCPLPPSLSLSLSLSRFTSSSASCYVSSSPPPPPPPPPALQRRGAATVARCTCHTLQGREERLDAERK